RDAVDGDDVLDVIGRVVAVAAPATAAPPAAGTAPATTAAAPPAAATAAATAAAAAPAAAPLLVGRRGRRRADRNGGVARLADRRKLLVTHLELQSAFAGAVGDGLHATMVTVAAAVEHHLRDARGL